MGELTDALFSCWRGDPIHGDKVAYTRITVGLVDKVLTKSLPEDTSATPSQPRSSRERTLPRERVTAAADLCPLRKGTATATAAPGNSQAARVTTLAILAARNSLETAEVSRLIRPTTRTRASSAALAAAAGSAKLVAAIQGRHEAKLEGSPFQHFVLFFSNPPGQ
jgi:hypothetical protein